MMISLITVGKEAWGW